MIHDLIYDVGMNNGDDTAYYLYRGFRVLAIEADPQLCSQASERFQKEIAEGRLEILNIGITAEPGEFDFWICESYNVWSSFNKNLAARHDKPHYSIKVPCQTFQWVLEKYGVPFYVKIDIEENDYLCIEALSPTDLPMYISFERDSKLHYQVLDKCKLLGYDRYKCIDQYCFIPLERSRSLDTKKYEILHYILLGKRNLFSKIIQKIFTQNKLELFWEKLQVLLRKQKDWTFPMGSSGAFGEATPGRWQSFDEIIETNHYFEFLGQSGKAPFWYDKGDSYWADYHVGRGR